jgi:hydroxymethylglutaryl-CoA lyase
MGGLGGCPFAQDDRIGNMPTETVLGALEARVIIPPVSGPLEEIRRQTAEIASRYS